MNTAEKTKKANARTMRKLFIVAVAMFGFGYALVPLYDVFCELTGINGKTKRGTIQQVAKVDTDRWITVEFTAHTNSSLPWEFRPMQSKMRVHPGQIVIAKYFARNTSAQMTTGRAVPSVSPSKAARYFKKIECFCFSEQQLKAGEQKEMPVQFYVDTKVPEEVDRITLSYAFFNAKKAKSTVMSEGKPVAISGHPVSGQRAVPDA